MQAAWHVLGAAQEAMEPLIMVAPPVPIRMRIRGFDGQVCSFDSYIRLALMN